MLICAHTQGFLLDKKIGMNQPKVIENAKILIANTSMDTDKIKVHALTLSLSHTLTSITHLLDFAGVWVARAG